MMKKKGVSDVIVTVLMILLVVAAIAIIWAVLANFLNRGTKDVESTADCMNTNLQLSEVYGFINLTRYSGNLVNGKVERFAGSSQITNLAFYIDGARITDGEVGQPLIVPGPGETTGFQLRLPGNTTTQAGKTIEVAAVFGSTICNVKSPKFTILTS